MDPARRPPYPRSVTLTLVGDTDSALAEIARPLRTPWGLTPWQLALDPGWDFLRGDPRFRALAAE